MKCKNKQTFCFANWVQNKGFLSMFCTAPGAFIRRNTVYTFHTACRRISTVKRSKYGKIECFKGHKLRLIKPTPKYTILTLQFAAHLSNQSYRRLIMDNTYDDTKILTLSQTSPCFYLSAV